MFIKFITVENGLDRSAINGNSVNTVGSVAPDAPQIPTAITIIRKI
ncbi:MAG: hypothetical protein IKT47_06730 [Oscillospiraceae bacterium]|nr:hypothetical protein [Oscillospiraceae bacterium]